MVGAFLWRALAWFLSRERIAAWIIKRAMRTPYNDIIIDGRTYMRRFWAFNPIPGLPGSDKLRQFAWLPNVRLNHILLPDPDRHLHDHPWDARTIILDGGYTEVREAVPHLRYRGTGDTATLRFDEFHRIVTVGQPIGAVTLFITWRKRGTWGFKVDGEKVPYRTYLGLPPKDE